MTLYRTLYLASWSTTGPCIWPPGVLLGGLLVPGLLGGLLVPGLLEASLVPGLLEASRVPGILEASRVPGILEASMVPCTLEASMVPGTLEASRVPPARRPPGYHRPGGLPVPSLHYNTLYIASWDPICTLGP